MCISTKYDRKCIFAAGKIVCGKPAIDIQLQDVSQQTVHEQLRGTPIIKYATWFHSVLNGS